MIELQIKIVKFSIIFLISGVQE